MSLGTRNHKMEDHNMGVARKKLQKQQQQQYKQTDKQKNIKGMSYDSTYHSAQLLAKNIRLDEEIDNPRAALSRSFLY